MDPGILSILADGSTRAITRLLHPHIMFMECFLYHMRTELVPLLQTPKSTDTSAFLYTSFPRLQASVKVYVYV